jgi:predicted CopG family antitoxin
MSYTINLPNDLYKRLESHATGFDSPSAVIERLLDYYESKPEKNAPNENAPQLIKIKKPELVFHPSQEEFKENLLKLEK